MCIDPDVALIWTLITVFDRLSSQGFNSGNLFYAHWTPNVHWKSYTNSGHLYFHISIRLANLTI